MSLQRSPCDGSDTNRFSSPQRSFKIRWMSGKIAVVSEYLRSPWTSSPTKGWFHQAPWFVAAVRTTCSAWSALGQPSTCVYSSTPSEPPTSSIITHCATSFF